jgi:hypothetical protein
VSSVNVPPREQEAGERVVALGHTLLDQIAEDDEQDEVERLHGRQLAPSHHTREEEDEDERQDGSDDDVH